MLTSTNQVLTSAYDCTLRSTSFVTGKSTELFSLASSSTLLTSFDLSSNGNEIWISDALGGISHVDLREGGRSRRQVNIKEKIGCISVNPRRDHLLATSSNDHALKLSFQVYLRENLTYLSVARIWDVRKLMQIETGSVLEEEGAPAVLEADNEVVDRFLMSKPGQGTVVAEYEHGQSASSAYWDPSGTRIVSTSYDSRLRGAFFP